MAPGDGLGVGTGKMAVEAGSRFPRGKWVLPPNQAENKTGANTGQKDDSGLDLLHLWCVEEIHRLNL